MAIAEAELDTSPGPDRSELNRAPFVFAEWAAKEVVGCTVERVEDPDIPAYDVVHEPRLSIVRTQEAE